MSATSQVTDSGASSTSVSLAHDPRAATLVVGLVSDGTAPAAASRPPSPTDVEVIPTLSTTSTTTTAAVVLASPPPRPRGLDSSKPPALVASDAIKEPRPKGVATALVSKTATTSSLATMHAYIVGEFADPRDWLVAVRNPAQASDDHAAGAHAETVGEAGPDSRVRPAEAAARALPALEQRLDVRGLQRIMKAFSDTVDLPSYVHTLEAESRADKAAATAAAAAVASPWAREFEAAAVHVDNPRGDTSCPSPRAATDDKQATTPAPHKTARSADDLTRFLLSTHLGEGEARQRLPPQDTYTRLLSLQSFTDVMQAAVPSATTGEVREFMTKVDYEAHGTMAWTDLATFLVSESRHHIHMALAKSELEAAMVPGNLPRTALHESVTAVSVDVRKRVLLTAGSEGMVRAWALSDLAPRGLLFANKHWISGVHCGHRSRYLYITTLDRELFVLDGNSYEVLQVYHGRPIAESSVGVAYAKETVRMVRVGGAKPASSSATSARVATASQASRRPRPSQPPQGQQARLLSAMDGGSPSGAFNGFAATGLLKSLGASRPLTASVAQQMLVSHDTAPLTSGGRGPYVEKRLAEGVLMGLVDSVVCSLYMHTALDEDVVLLGTSAGDVHIFELDVQKPALVLKPRRCLHLHPGKTIYKMEFLASLDALVTCADDGTVRMTSLINAQQLRVFSAPSHLAERHSAVHDMAICDASKMLVTVGPERSGLVWDFGQEAPIAVLEAHNSPCRSCAILARQQQILTTAADGALFVFDMASFHRVQSLHLGTAQVVRQLRPDDARQRCLAFARQPFALRVKRQAASACPPQYTGPVATMFTSLYTPVFDLIVTVDQDRMVMTWTRSTGKNVFAFLLKDFSDSEAMNQLGLTAVALDELGRRLLTGFHNGAVVVWNAVNGQPVNVITAATVDGESEPQTAVTTAARRALSAAPPKKTPALNATALTHTHTHTSETTTTTNNNSSSPIKSAGASPTAATMASASPDVATLDTTPSPRRSPGHGRDVTAVGSLVRLGTTYLLFAARRMLYTVPESTTFTVATATRWPTPEAYGEVTSITQVTSQSVVCGTSHGALFFYNVLQEKQEGATQYAKELVFAVVAASAPSHGLPARRGSLSGLPRTGSFTNGGGLGTSTTNLFSATAGPASSPVKDGGEDTTSGIGGGGVGGAAAEALTSPSNRTHVHTVCVGSSGATCVSYLRRLQSRVIRLVPLKQVSPHLLLSLHADGTVSLWQTLRRMYLGGISLTTAGVDEGMESGGAVVANVNARGTHLVFADEGGNVHVCTMSFCRLEPGSAVEKAVMTADNPALYLTSISENQSWLEEASRTGFQPCRRVHGKNNNNNIDSDHHPTVTPTKGDADKDKDEDGEVTAVVPPSPADAALRETEPSRETSTASRGTHAEDRVLYVPDVLARVDAFGTGLSHIVSLLVLDPKDVVGTSSSSSSSPSEGEDGKRDGDADKDKDTSDEPSALTGLLRTLTEPIIVCTDQEHYTRLFTLHGDVIGELGMGEWDLQDPATYRYMGEPTAALPLSRIPYSKLSGEESELARHEAVFYDYLAETYAAQQQARQEAVNAATSARRPRGRSQVQAGTQRRSSLGSLAGASLVLSGGGGACGASAAATMVMSTTNAARSPLHSPSRTRPRAASTTTLTPNAPAVATASGATLAASLKAALVASGGAGDKMGATEQAMNAQPPSSTQPLDTTLAKSTRVRSGFRANYRGLVKRDHAAFVRRQAAVTMTTQQSTAATTTTAAPTATAAHAPDDASPIGEGLELQSEFLVLLTRASFQGSTAAAAAATAPDGDDDEADTSLKTAALPAASASTPPAKASVATTAPGEDAVAEPSGSSARQSPVPPPVPRADSLAFSPTPLPALSPRPRVDSTGASADPAAPTRVGSMGLLSPALSPAPAVRGVPSSTPTMTTANAAISRRHKSGLGTASVAVRPDSATRQADARERTHAMLSERRDRILNSTVNAATLRALREADGSEVEVGPERAVSRPPSSRRSEVAGEGRGAGLSEDLGPTLTPMHEQVNTVLRRRRQYDTGIAATLSTNGARSAAATTGSGGAAAGTQGASSFIAQVASKMYVAPMPALPKAPAARGLGTRETKASSQKTKGGQ